MKKLIESKYGKFMLVIFVLSIWGVNAISFSELWSLNSTGVVEERKEIDTDNLSIPTIINYEYHPTERNPFFPPNSVRKPSEISRVIPIAKEREPLKLNLFLTGILDEMAIIKDESGYIYFVSEKDTFNKIFVESILNDSVKLTYGENKITIKIIDD